MAADLLHPLISQSVVPDCEFVTGRGERKEITSQERRKHLLAEESLQTRAAKWPTLKKSGWIHKPRGIWVVLSAAIKPSNNFKCLFFTLK